jgi:hypothetical protein
MHFPNISFILVTAGPVGSGITSASNLVASGGSRIVSISSTPCACKTRVCLDVCVHASGDMEKKVVSKDGLLAYLKESFKNKEYEYFSSIRLFLFAGTLEFVSSPSIIRLFGDVYLCLHQYPEAIRLYRLAYRKMGVDIQQNNTLMNTYVGRSVFTLYSNLVITFIYALLTSVLETRLVILKLQ